MKKLQEYLYQFIDNNYKEDLLLLDRLEKVYKSLIDARNLYESTLSMSYINHDYLVKNKMLYGLCDHMYTYDIPSTYTTISTFMKALGHKGAWWQNKGGGCAFDAQEKIKEHLNIRLDLINRILALYEEHKQ